MLSCKYFRRNKEELWIAKKKIIAHSMRFKEDRVLTVKPKFGSTSCEAMGAVSLNLGLLKNNNNPLVTFFYVKLPSTYW